MEWRDILGAATAVIGTGLFAVIAAALKLNTRVAILEKQVEQLPTLIGEIRDHLKALRGEIQTDLKGIRTEKKSDHDALYKHIEELRQETKGDLRGKADK